MITKIEIIINQEIPYRLYEDIKKNLFWIDKGIQDIILSDQDPYKIIVLYDGISDIQAIKKHLELFINRTFNTIKKVKPKMFYNSKIKSQLYRSNAYAELVYRGLIKEDAEGSFIYSGIMAQLYFALDQVFLKIAKKIGAKEIRIPSLISAKTLINSGYLNSYPHHTNYVFHLDESLDIVKNFQKGINQKTQTLNLSEIPSSSLEPKTLLTPAVCQCYYRTLSNQTLQDEITIVTGNSNCFRYESKATYGLKRLREFGIREIIAVGTRKKVVEFRQTLLEILQQCLELCSIQSTILTASDPFFIDNYHTQRLYQISLNLKHEATAYIPFDNSYLAISSVNYHVDHFGKAWNIKTPDGETAHSSCMGFGLDRWCYTIFAQYGFNIESWPKEIREIINNE